MFEKEAEEKLAEEYANGYATPDLEDSFRAYMFEAGKDGFLAGYNKANEWHYPSKGELPKDDKDMLMSNVLLLVTKMKGSDCLSLALGQYNFLTQEFSYQHIVGLTDVYAWKEIVLPKESE